MEETSAWIQEMGWQLHNATEFIEVEVVPTTTTTDRAEIS
jgi:hypothetical protein